MFKRYLIWSAVIHLILLLWAGSYLPSPSARLQKAMVIKFITSDEIQAKGDMNSSQHTNRTIREATDTKEKEEDTQPYKKRNISSANPTTTGLNEPLEQDKIENTKSTIKQFINKENFINKEKKVDASGETKLTKEEIEVKQENAEKEKKELTAGKDQIDSTSVIEDPKESVDKEKVGNGRPESETGKNILREHGNNNEPDILPILISKKEPFYPLLARRRGWEGSVILEIQLKTDGRVGEVCLIESSGHKILDEEACKAIREWIYEPAYKKGLPVDFCMKVKVTFSLENSASSEE